MMRTPSPMAPMPSMPASRATACACATTSSAAWTNWPLRSTKRTRRQAVLRGQQRPATQRQGAQLSGRHGAGGGAQARRADHGRPRADRHGARDAGRKCRYIFRCRPTRSISPRCVSGASWGLAHHPVARAVARRSRRNPPGMPGHGARSLRPWRAVHRLLRPLPAVRLLQPSRPQPGHVHQLLPLGLQAEAGGRRSD
jgi:hypothetical protein